MHQDRTSPLASDFDRRQGNRKEFRSGDHSCPIESLRKSPFAIGVQLQRKGVFAEKGARFRGKWGLGPPPPPAPRPRPPPFSWGAVGVLLKIPGKGGLSGEGGGGARGVCEETFIFWGGGGEGSPRAPSPIYRENEPPFRRKRLRNCTSWGLKKL